MTSIQIMMQSLQKLNPTFKSFLSAVHKEFSTEREQIRTQHIKLLQEIADKLNIKTWEDWYNIHQHQVIDNGGLQLVLHYGSFRDALKKLLPQHPWKPWNFALARGSFNTLKSQREFLDELAKRLNINHWEEWYSVTKAKIDEKGGAYLVHCFKDSPQATLANLYPEHPWIPWKFNAVTEGFWKDKQNVRNFLEDIGKNLGIQKWTDWYNVTNRDIRNNGGSAMLNHYNNSLFLVLKTVFPEHPWEKQFIGTKNSKSQTWLHSVLLHVFPTFDIHMNHLLLDRPEEFELDFYIPAVKLGFEYQGEQHYNPESYFGSKNQSERDYSKRNLCSKYDITLIEVPYWWDKRKESLIATIHKIRPDLKLIQGNENFSPIPTEKPINM